MPPHDPNDAKIDAYHQELDSRLERIRTRKDLEEFSLFLAKGVEMDAFEYTHLVSFFEGMAMSLHSLDGWCKNSKVAVPEQPDWQWMGRLMVQAIYLG